MSNPRLDLKAPGLGTIYPPFKGAQYVLDGNYYSPQGDLLWSDKGVVVAGEKAGAADPAPATSPEAKTPKASVDPNDVDLGAWYRGEAKYPFYAVKKAALELIPDADVSNGDAIRAALVAGNYVSKA